MASRRNYFERHASIISTSLCQCAYSDYVHEKKSNHANKSRCFAVNVKHQKRMQKWRGEREKNTTQTNKVETNSESPYRSNSLYVLFSFLLFSISLSLSQGVKTNTKRNTEKNVEKKENKQSAYLYSVLKIVSSMQTRVRSPNQVQV